MSNLPIVHMTLYKHGVGFFERRAQLEGREVELSFRVEEMNDILKSLTAIDWGGGQVLGVDYATPQSPEERLAGCSIRLDDDRSLRDLLVGLRGRPVRLSLDQGEELGGTLVGLDELPERQPVAESLVSVLLDGSTQVQTVRLGRVQSVDILDERGARDLRFFLQTALTQEDYRQVTVRLTPGDHDLSVSYIAPAPTWRVSYRLVTGERQEGDADTRLLGWGIFDNRLEEDLTDISLSLVAGMPISFVYDLYTPFTPERPKVQEEARVAAAPVEFGAKMMMRDAGAEFDTMQARGAAAEMAAPAMQARAMQAMTPAAMAAAAPAQASGESLGELFQYTIDTPVTVGRGQSAMVPIVSVQLTSKKDLLYNGAKLAAHPVATLRLSNESGLTLERGPVTVIEGGEYVGEAVLPFTADRGEIVVAYAVELGAKVRESRASRRQIHGLSIKGAYLTVEEWEIRTTTYQVNNRTAKPLAVLVEHPRSESFDLVEPSQPQETTDAHWRFEVGVGAQAEAKLAVVERQLVRRREELRNQSYAGLEAYLKQGLLDRRTHDGLVKLLKLEQLVADQQKQAQELEQERAKIYAAQQQVQGNMQALGTTGKEGALRARYVEQLEASENRLKLLAQEEVAIQGKVQELEAEIRALLARLS